MDETLTIYNPNNPYPDDLIFGKLWQLFHDFDPAIYWQATGVEDTDHKVWVMYRGQTRAVGFAHELARLSTDQFTALLTIYFSEVLKMASPFSSIGYSQSAEELLLSLPPAVRAWIDTLELQPGTIQSVSLDRSLERDLEREKALNSLWAYWTPGDTITVTITCLRGSSWSVHQKPFNRQVWQAENSMNKIETPGD